MKNTIKTIQYQVTVRDGHSIPDSNYSQYYKRLAAFDAGKLRGHIYGLPQAIAHAAELRNHVHDEKKPYEKTTFEIVQTITRKGVVKTLSA